MKNEKKQAKELFKERSLAYNAWVSNMTVPIATVAFFILGLLGQKGGYGFITLFLAIYAHRFNVKLKLGAKSYIAPIMVYVYQVLSIPVAVLLFNSSELAIFPLIAFEILCFAAIIISFVFFWITANQIKKQFPTLKEDRQAALQEYKATIASLK